MLFKGDCLKTLKTLPDCSIDSIVTDPPYELGFMGKTWDNSGIAYNQDLWAECLRVLKPGGHLLAFSGSRTYHRMTVAIEDAGFEIRDQIMWLYGSGFPKSLNVSKAIDKAAGLLEHEASAFTVAGRTDKNLPSPVTKGYVPPKPQHPEAQRWQGWGTALKPAHEPICVARKPLTGTVASNVLEWGTGALNIDGCRIGTEGGTRRDGKADTPNDAGWGNMKGHGIAELNAGRWPANVIHDGSDEVLAGFPNSKGGAYPAKRGQDVNTSFASGQETEGGYRAMGDDGSAARFFFSTKGDYDEGLWHDLNLHPETANIAEPHLSQPERNDASVLVHVLNLALQEALRCVGLSVERSMTVTANESKQIVESVMQATQSIAAKFWLGSSLESITLSSNHAKVVATHEPTGITTITTSLRKSDGYAEPVTFSITPTFSGHGEKASSGKSFIYCAKASKSERNAGLEPCRCDKLSAWAKEDQPAPPQAGTELLAKRDTDASGTPLSDDSEWNTSLSGKGPTDWSPMAIKSTTSTTTNSTTDWKTSNSSAPLNTSASTRGANLGTVSGGNLATFAGSSSQSEPSIGISAERAGHSTGDADPATSAESLPASNKGNLFCPKCGGLKGGHPTVKPLALMRYLVKMVTPPGGTVLDPFLGSGSTAVAAILEGFDWIGCEMTEDYWPIIEARVQWAHNQPKILL